MKNKLKLAGILVGMVMSNVAFGQACSGVNITTVATGSVFGTRLRVDNLNCGQSGWVCLDENSTVDATLSRQLYATALTAQASESPIVVVFDNEESGLCGGNFPAVRAIRIQ